MASHPGTGRIIAKTDLGSWAEAGEVVLLESNSSGSLRELLRWRPRPDTEQKYAVYRVYMVDEHLVLARIADRIHMWDLARRSERWFLDIDRSHRAAVSAGLNYFAAQVQNEIAIFDIQSGKQLTSIELPNNDAVKLAFTPSGSKLAAVAGRTIRVFDLANRENDHVCDLTEKLDTYHSDPFWVDEDHLMAGGKRLIDPKIGHVIWSYDAGHLTKTATAFQNGKLRATTAGRSGIIFYSLPIPHQTVLDAKAAANFDDAVLVDRGSEVRVKFDVSENTDVEKARELVEAAVLKVGWRIIPAASTTLTYSDYRASEIKQTYRSGNFKGQELPFRPYASVVEVTINDEPIFRAVGGGRAPNNMEIALNETLAEAIERQTVPSYRLIENLELPARIVKPEFVNGWGHSKLNGDHFVDGPTIEFPTLPKLSPRD